MIAAVASSMVFSLAMPVLPLFPHEFGIGAGTATWIVFANSLAGAVMTPVMGRIGDLIGPRRTLMAAMGALAAGSVICALAPNLGVMILGRVLQGTANSTLPLGVGVARRVLPAGRLSRATGWLSAALGIGSGFGITAAGLLLLVLPWRALFGVMGGLALMALISIWIRIPASADTRAPHGRLDWFGAVGLAMVLPMLMIPISEAPHLGLGHPSVWGLLIGFVVVGSVWVRHQLRTPTPLVNLRTARIRWVALGYALNVVVGVGMFLSLLTSVLQVQAPHDLPYGLDRSTFVAGLSLLGGNVAMLLAPRPTAWATRRFGERTVLATGLFIVCLGYLYRVGFRGHLIEIILGYTFVQFGLAMLMAVLSLVLVRHAPAAETSTAQGIGTTARMIGMGACGSAYAAFVARGSVVVDGQVFPTEATLVTTFLVVAAVTGLVGLVMAASELVARH